MTVQIKRAALALVLVLVLGVAGRAGPTRPVMKPVICRVLEGARGKTGAPLAMAIENEASEIAYPKYALVALLSGDPPIACFRSLAESTQLPPGAK